MCSVNQTLVYKQIGTVGVVDPEICDTQSVSSELCLSLKQLYDFVL
jgi:hypothetical protein